MFACNLKCAGCGKIAQPATLLKQRMPVEQAVAAIEESGAPMVSIAGGEPLMHPQIDEIVRQLLDRNKIVFLCTNAVLLPKHLHKFKPHRNFAWMVHIDGLRERHDESVCKDGVFDQAVAAIKQAQAAGFRVNTNTTFFDTDTPQDVIDVLDFLNNELHIDNMQISPGFAYEKAPDQEHWLGVEQTRELFAKAFGDGRRKQWRLNHSPMFLDFLEGKRGLSLHGLGDPVVLPAGLAAALLPHGRRLRRDLPGTRRGDGLVEATGAATIPGARTAWRTAATSPPPSSPRWVRSGNPCGPPGEPDRAAPVDPRVDGARQPKRRASRR